MEAKQVLNETPAALADQDRKIVDLEFRLESKRDLLARTQLAAAVDVAQAVDTAGKPLFTNQTLRDHETQWRLGTDEGYKVTKRAVEELSRAIADAKVEREFHKNLQLNARALVLGGELAEALHG